MKAIVTIIGKDKVGIIAEVSRIMAEANMNILDISQTVMSDFFTMMMMVDISEASMPLSEASELLNEAGKRMNLSIQLQHEDLFNAMHRI